MYNPDWLPVFLLLLLKYEDKHVKDHFILAQWESSTDINIDL